MMRKPWLHFLLALTSAACAGPNAPSDPSDEGTESAGAERADEANDGVAITGLRGTLSQQEVQGALEPRLMKFSRCIQKRSMNVEWLAGELELVFHVALDGSVTRVFPTCSTFGDRAAERCMVEVARKTRFPRPHGGEADFSWSLDMPLDPDLRSPVAWTTRDAAERVDAETPALLQACGGGVFLATAYVDTEGKVIAAGAATQNEDDAEKLDCVAEQIATWEMPSPGSYPAKIELELR